MLGRNSCHDLDIGQPNPAEVFFRIRGTSSQGLMS